LTNKKFRVFIVLIAESASLLQPSDEARFVPASERGCVYAPVSPGGVMGNMLSLNIKLQAGLYALCLARWPFASSKKKAIPSDFVHYSNVTLLIIDEFPPPLPPSVPSSATSPSFSPVHPFEAPFAPIPHAPPAFFFLPQLQANSPKFNHCRFSERRLLLLFPLLLP